MDCVDVVIVGAGFSGLVAARQLAEVGLDVVVLEALPVVGGRTRTTSWEGTSLEVGGQWASTEHTELLALAAEVGVPAFPTPTAGRGVIVSGGQRTDVEFDAAEEPLAHAVARLDALAMTLPKEAPWDSPDAAELDHETIDRWADREISDHRARRQMVTIIEELMTVPAAELSVLTVLEASRSSGTLSAAMGIDGGAQELRLMGGMHEVAARLADSLGAIVRTETPVSQVAVDDDLVVVQAASGSIRARRVIMALAPSMARSVSFEPLLPPARRSLHRRMPMGSVIKVNLVYDRPFWRDDGLSGLVMDFDGPMTYGVDNSWPDHGRGVLASFFAGAHARRFSALGRRARQASALAQVTRWFGPRAGEPIAYVDHDWTTEPWIGGGYSGVMEPGAWQECGPALRRSVGPVHWAGSESANEWNGYVEGAIRSGRRAAIEVLGHLDRRT